MRVDMLGQIYYIAGCQLNRMYMKKKALAYVITSFFTLAVACLLAFALSGCGDDEDTSVATAPIVDPSQQQVFDPNSTSDPNSPYYSGNCGGGGYGGYGGNFQGGNYMYQSNGMCHMFYGGVYWMSFPYYPWYGFSPGGCYTIKVKVKIEYDGDGDDKVDKVKIKKKTVCYGPQPYCPWH